VKWLISFALVLSALVPGRVFAQAQDRVVLANDGRSLASESFETRATFAAVFSDRAAAQWAADHNAQLSVGAPARPYRLGWLSASSIAAGQVTRDGFLQRISELGYHPGQDVTIDWQYADGQVDAFPSLASEIVGRNPDAVVIGGGADGVVVKQATSTIPLVMITGTDPVANGLVASLDRPGGNVTGFLNISPAAYGKMVDLIKQLVPNVAHIGVLLNPASASAAIALNDIRQSGERLGVQIQPLEIRSNSGVTAAANEIPSAFDAAAAASADAVIVIGDTALFNPNQQRIAALAIQKRIPLVTNNRPFAENGALVHYGPSATEIPRRTAEYVDKILKGAKPVDLPVGSPSEFEITLNLRTAQAIGLTVPAPVLAMATNVLR
jgi:ABC-type uncharacterized transport system substrate-binding protein